VGVDVVPTVVEQRTSPDYEYLWLDLVWKSPVFLGAGQHSVRYSAVITAADGPRVTESLSKIDAFFIQPAVARRSFTLLDGRVFVLTYNTLSGSASLSE
jgi:hypothetical protein